MAESIFSPKKKLFYLLVIFKRYTRLRVILSFCNIGYWLKKPFPSFMILFLSYLNHLKNQHKENQVLDGFRVNPSLGSVAYQATCWHSTVRFNMHLSGSHNRVKFRCWGTPLWSAIKLFRTPKRSDICLSGRPKLNEISILEILWFHFLEQFYIFLTLCFL